MNMCMLEVAMREKCRSSHFQSKGVLLLGEGEGGGQYPITCHCLIGTKYLLKKQFTSIFSNPMLYQKW